MADVTITPEAQTKIDAVIAELPTALQSVAVTWTPALISLFSDAVNDGVNAVALRLKEISDNDLLALHEKMTDAELTAEKIQMVEVAKEAAQKSYNAQHVLSGFASDVAKTIFSMGLTAVVG